MLKISCGEKITEADYTELNQNERRHLAELVKEWQKVDKMTPLFQLREKAYYKVLADCIPFD